MGAWIVRRCVFYLPGYDPIPPRRYRELYRSEGARQAGISGYALTMSPARPASGFGWRCQGTFSDARTDCEFRVLTWSDLVRNSMGASIIATYAQLARTAWVYIASGALFALARLRLAPVLAALYPIATLIIQLIIAVVVAVALAVGLSVPGLSAWLTAPLAVLAGAGVLAAFKRADSRFFAYYLMHDYAFTARDNGTYPPELEMRLARFCDDIAGQLDNDWDEVMVVGHSSGAYLAVSVLADLLRDGRVPSTANLSFLSLGQVVPMASFLPAATRLRADLEVMGTQERIFWLDVSAPGDACCFGLCDPVAVSRARAAPQSQPLIMSAAFGQTLSQDQKRALSGRWFHKHFQYLCAFDRPGDYDYFTITCGPRTLRERYHGRHHSPTRIATPVNRYAKVAR